MSGDRGGNSGGGGGRGGISSDNFGRGVTDSDFSSRTGAETREQLRGAGVAGNEFRGIDIDQPEHRSTSIGGQRGQTAANKARVAEGLGLGVPQITPSGTKKATEAGKDFTTGFDKAQSAFSILSPIASIATGDLFGAGFGLLTNPPSLPGTFAEERRTPKDGPAEPGADTPSIADTTNIARAGGGSTNDRSGSGSIQSPSILNPGITVTSPVVSTTDTQPDEDGTVDKFGRKQTFGAGTLLTRAPSRRRTLFG